MGASSSKASGKNNGSNNDSSMSPVKFGVVEQTFDSRLKVSNTLAKIVCAQCHQTLCGADSVLNILPFDVIHRRCYNAYQEAGRLRCAHCHDLAWTCRNNIHTNYTYGTKYAMHTSCKETHMAYQSGCGSKQWDREHTKDEVS
jgi:hypothetical protein